MLYCIFSCTKYHLDLGSKKRPPTNPNGLSEKGWANQALIEISLKWLKIHEDSVQIGRCVEDVFPRSFQYPFLRHTACAKDPACVTTQQSTSNKHEHVFMATNIPVQVLSFLRSNRSNLSFHPVWIHQDHLYQWLRLFSLKLPTGIQVRPNSSCTSKASVTPSCRQHCSNMVATSQVANLERWWQKAGVVVRGINLKNRTNTYFKILK